VTLNDAYRRLAALEDRTSLPLATHYPVWRGEEDRFCDTWPAVALSLALLGGLCHEDADDEDLLAAVRRGNDVIVSERWLPLEVGSSVVARLTVKLLDLYYLPALAMERTS
jgi:hypothetical protein